MNTTTNEEYEYMSIDNDENLADDLADTTNDQVTEEFEVAEAVQSVEVGESVKFKFRKSPVGYNDTQTIDIHDHEGVDNMSIDSGDELEAVAGDLESVETGWFDLSYNEDLSLTSLKTTKIAKPPKSPKLLASSPSSSMENRQKHNRLKLLALMARTNSDTTKQLKMSTKRTI